MGRKKPIDWDEFVERWALNPFKKVREFWRWKQKNGIPTTFWFLFHFFLASIPIISRLEWELEKKIFNKLSMEGC